MTQTKKAREQIRFKNEGKPSHWACNYGSALLSGTNNSPESSSPVSDSESQFKLPPERFYPLKQVRTEIDDHSIYELAQTFLTHGQLQAITVYPPDADGRYCIYNGERRCAAQLIPDFTLDAKIMTGQVLKLLSAPVRQVGLPRGSRCPRHHTLIQ